jgi:8-oxo-dGTP pyrophosphatase MutT (NUDIX family)
MELVAGSREPEDNSFRDSFRRELYEETGIEVEESDVDGFRPFIMRWSHRYYHVQPFHIELDEMPEVILSDEHVGSEWYSADDMDVLGEDRYFTFRYVEDAMKGREEFQDESDFPVLPVLDLRTAGTEDMDKILDELE